MIKKHFIALTALLLIACLLPGAALAADLDEILSSGTIRIGMYNQDPGRMYLDPMTNELMGLEPDIAADFASYLGVKLEIVQMEWDSLIPGLLADKCDIIIANMARLPSRATTVDFTLAYENYDGTCIAVRKEEQRIQGWSDLTSGVKVGTGRGNSAEAYTIKTCPQAEIVPFASPQLGVQALLAGQVDCVVEDYTAMISFEKQFEGIKLVATDQLVNRNTTGFAVKPGNFRLWLWANIFLISYKNSGDYANTWYKWFPDVPITGTAFDVG